MLTVAGRRWGGRCCVDGDLVEVISAYGSASSSLGRRKAQRVAEELMLQILRAKLAELETAATAI
jgi:hypothetical protein